MHGFVTRQLPIALTFFNALVASTLLMADEFSPISTVETIELPKGLPLNAETALKLKTTKAWAQLSIAILESFNEIGINRQIQFRLNELKSQVDQIMPDSGGVLVTAYVDETRLDTGSMKRLRSVVVRGAFESREAALSRLSSSDQYLAPPAAKTKLPAAGPSNPFIRTRPSHFWFSPANKNPSLTDHKAFNESRLRVLRLLETIRLIHQSEKDRLAIEWQSIEARNSKNNDLRFEVGTKEDDVDALKNRQANELQEWERHERSKIASAAKSVSDLRAALGRERADRHRITEEYCPAGLTYHECREHLTWKRGIDRKLAEADQRITKLERAAFEQSGKINQMNSQLESRYAAINNSLTNKLEEVRKANADKKTLEGAEREFADRLAKYTHDEESLASIGLAIQAIEEVLAINYNQ